MLIGPSEPAARRLEPSLGGFARLPGEHPPSSVLGDPWDPQHISYTMSSLPHLKAAPDFVVFLPIASYGSITSTRHHFNHYKLQEEQGPYVSYQLTSPAPSTMSQ